MAESGDWGLVLVVDDSDLSFVLRELIAKFLSTYPFETETVTSNPRLTGARFVEGIEKRIGRLGAKVLPSLWLLARNDAGLRDARPIASGVVDLTEIARRLSVYGEGGTKMPLNVRFEEGGSGCSNCAR